MTIDLTAPAMPDAEDIRDLRSLACSILDKYAADALTVPQQALPFDESLWQTLAEAGLTLLSTPVSAGGSGAGIAEAAALLSAAAEYAAPGPLAEGDLLAAWLLTAAQLDIPTGPLTSGTCEVACLGGRRGDGAGRGHGRPGALGEGLRRRRGARHERGRGGRHPAPRGPLQHRAGTQRGARTSRHGPVRPRSAARVRRADPQWPGPRVVAAWGAGQVCADLRSDGDCPGSHDRARVATHPVRSPDRQVPGSAAPGRGGRRGSHRRAGRVRGGRADRRTGRDREPCWGAGRRRRQVPGGPRSGRGQPRGPPGARRHRLHPRPPAAPLHPARARVARRVRWCPRVGAPGRGLRADSVGRTCGHWSAQVVPTRRRRGWALSARRRRP